MWNSETGEVFPITLYFTKKNGADLAALDFSAGVHMDLGVEHLHAPADGWNCDLNGLASRMPEL